jgi:hypothetical protein
VTRSQVALVVFGVVVAAIFAGQIVPALAPLYRDVFTDTVLLRLGAVTKLLFLFLAWRGAARIANGLEADNPARRPWRQFAIGLLLFALGQGVLSTYQLVTGQSPYPSPGDVFFLAAYPVLVLATIGLIRAYRDSGYPVGSASERAGIAIGLAIVFTVLGVLLLRPILQGGGPLLERLLTAGYPALDFVLLIPVLLLLRISSRFRGGSIFQAWAALLAGLIALCAADILYAYFAVMDAHQLEPLVDAAYVLAYLLVALGTEGQRQLLVA